MHPTRKSLVLLLCGVAAWYGWNAFARSAREVVTLHVPAGAGTQDHFARLWAVDAPPFLWIRAETPERSWLEPLRENPLVTLYRGERSARYEASVWDTPEARDQVDRLFREKYGLADLVRGWIARRLTIPIRLTPL